jgi:hypothetical protein
LKRTGAKITVDFDVPNPPLAWEETISPPHQAANTARSIGVCQKNNAVCTTLGHKVAAAAKAQAVK